MSYLGGVVDGCCVATISLLGRRARCCWILEVKVRAAGQCQAKMMDQSEHCQIPELSRNTLSLFPFLHPHLFTYTHTYSLIHSLTTCTSTFQNHLIV
jgi:hypothetical protein